MNTENDPLYTAPPATRESWVRLIVTLCAITLVVATAGYIRARQDAKAPDQLTNVQQLFQLKTFASSSHDLVLVGDSRVYRGVSPDAMRDVLPELRILNMGFSSGGMSDPLLAAAQAKLDRASSQQTIVLGVTPFSLTPEAVANEHWHSCNRRGPGSAVQHAGLRSALKAFRPVVEPPIPGVPSPNSAQYLQKYYADGWVASKMVPPQPQSALRQYQDNFSRSQVDPAVLAALCQKVTTWREAGIRVFAFRPPTTDEMLELEDELSGYVEEDVRQALEAAGADWLDFSGEFYLSYDGSHLSSDDAIRFSQDLAKRISSRYPR